MATYSAIKNSGAGYTAEGKGEVFVLNAITDFTAVYSTKPSLANNYAGTLATLAAADVVNALNIPALCAVLNGAVKILTAAGGAMTATVQQGANLMTGSGAVTMNSAVGTVIPFGNTATSYWTATSNVQKMSLVPTADTTLDYVLGGTVSNTGKYSLSAVVARLFTV